MIGIAERVLSREEASIGSDDICLPFEQLANLDDHSGWRRLMAERIAMEMNYELFGVKSIYLIGSVENGDAGLCSDIDLLLHIEDSREKREMLELWLDGWSKALGLTNYLRTGYYTSELLDVHIVTDVDVRNKDSFAVKMKNPAESSRLNCRC